LGLDAQVSVSTQSISPTEGTANAPPGSIQLEDAACL
jgi:hypothetical protein